MDLASPIEDVKGVGPKTSEVLNHAGIFTLRDLVYHLPRTYQDFQEAQSIKDLKPDQVAIKARVDAISTSRKRRGLSLTEATLRDSTGAVRAIWFNQPYRAKQLATNKEYYFSGKLEFSYGRFQLMNPSAEASGDIDKGAENGLQPIYPARGTVKTNDFRKFIKNIQNQIALTPDMIPNFEGRADALLSVHFPENIDDATEGRNYLATEELFSLLLASRLNREANQQLRTTPIKCDLPALQKLIKSLPFSLTNAQRRAVWEIIKDMEKDIPMNRLLQGDVGSGKTMVAALSGFVAARAGMQTAIMAPTEVLAAQHAESLSELFGDKLSIALLTGSTKHKTELKKHIASGEVDMVVGTHALITDDTKFHNLGLAIIDEQHRFGVAQRQKLLSKAHTMPHLLSMTATPIPRSLQLTIFGDLDVSILNELPKGRQPITTKILKETDIREQLYPKITEIIKSGQQVYWICKAIDDDPRTETTSVKSRSLNLQKLFPKYKIEFLHGRMKPAEKDEIMGRFKDGKTDILVSTTVVEVGVDVPNANLMIIENAENYGLAQIHQLRGRVGRGDKAAFCYLLTASDMNPSRRLRELEKSTDGFHLAEIDLKLRGPGEIYGVLQHGALDLRIASLSDTKLIHRAQKDVAEFLQNPENMLKYKELMNTITKYQQITTLN